MPKGACAETEQQKGNDGSNGHRLKVLWGQSASLGWGSLRRRRFVYGLIAPFLVSYRLDVANEVKGRYYREAGEKGVTLWSVI